MFSLACIQPMQQVSGVDVYPFGAYEKGGLPGTHGADEADRRMMPDTKHLRIEGEMMDRVDQRPEHASAATPGMVLPHRDLSALPACQNLPRKELPWARAYWVYGVGPECSD
jgi:hypothetical protein